MRRVYKLVPFFYEEKAIIKLSETLLIVRHIGPSTTCRKRTSHDQDACLLASDRPSAPYGVYFEGTNILVKIDGHDPAFRNVGGVLFSAHYDSVSSAPGAVDDGMGVVTLLQLIRWFTSDQGRPMRTVIFNINNGEEDWLNGAHA